jgi:hypothetical protein
MEKTTRYVGLDVRGGLQPAPHRQHHHADRVVRRRGATRAPPKPRSEAPAAHYRRFQMSIGAFINNLLGCVRID